MVVGVFDRYPNTNESREEEKEARLDDGWMGMLRDISLSYPLCFVWTRRGRKENGARRSETERGAKYDATTTAAMEGAAARWIEGNWLDGRLDGQGRQRWGKKRGRETRWTRERDVWKDGGSMIRGRRLTGARQRAATVLCFNSPTVCAV